MEKAILFTDRYFKNTTGELNILGKFIKIAIIIITIRVIVSILYKVIDKALRNKKGTNIFVSDKRVNTIKEIIKKIIKYTLYFIGIMMILDMFGINTSSILATAGIGGIAIGFGAQSLVKDIITGFFILLEDQYAVGDFVKIDSYEGVVEELGLRVTKLRDFSGQLHIIPNGSVEIVTNSTRGAMRALVQISIAYEENIDEAIEVLNRACEEIKDSNESILEGPSIVGVSDLDNVGVTLRIVARTKPMEQWSVEREIRKKAKEALDRANIEIPYPRLVVFGGEKSDS